VSITDTSTLIAMALREVSQCAPARHAIPRRLHPSKLWEAQREETCSVLLADGDVATGGGS
jgi:hypothetical protein